VGAIGLQINNTWVSLVTGLRFVNDSNGPWTLLAAELHNELRAKDFRGLRAARKPTHESPRGRRG
jgi:hypothetical protein